MLFKSALVALGASLAAVGAQSNTTCHNYVLISIRGTFELQGPSVGFFGMINQTLGNLTGGVEYDAVYPASVNQTAYLGADDVTAYINRGLQNCPKQKYAILGYSQGASATMLTLANITDPSTAAYQAIKAVLVIGNPYHVPNATLNVDQFGGNLTRKYPGAGYNAQVPGNTGIAPIYYSNGELLDICHTEDSVCAPAYPNASFDGHLKYGEDNVQNMGATFLINHLRAYAGSNSSTASPSGTGVARPTGTGGVKPTGTGAMMPSSTAAAPYKAGSSFVVPSGLFAAVFSAITLAVLSI